MKVILATGGTGGHIFPAICLAKELRTQGDDVLFVGVFPKSIRQYLEKENFRYRCIIAKGLSGNRVQQIIRLLSHAVGLVQSSVHVVWFKPKVVVGFGGYGAVPVCVAAWLFKKAIIIHEQNVHPGKSNCFLACLAEKICISFSESEKYLPKHKVVWTGYPLLNNNTIDQHSAIKLLGLDSGRKTVLIMGGSQGSQAVNQTALAVLSPLNERIPIQAIYLTGQKDYEAIKQNCSRIDVPVQLFPFFENMSLAYAAADIVIARAGAGSIFELVHFRKKAILIPYPYAAGHQRLNAAVLAETGSARIIEQEDLSFELLETYLYDLLNDSHFITEQQVVSINQPQAVQKLREAICSLKH